MKSWFNIYIFIALYCFGMVSCTDESMVEEGNLFDEVVVRLSLSVPGTDSRVGGNYQPDKSGLDEQTVPQRFIDDAYILLFNSNDHTLIAASPATFLDNKNGEATRTIKGKFTKQNSNLDIVVLANVLQNGIAVNFANYTGKTEKDIYDALVYEYPKAGWKLESNARFLPMWGKKTNITLNQREISISNFELYRGVAKMGLQVAETCNNFTMKEIYVYHVNNKGYCVAPNEIPNPDVNIQYTKPDVPSSSSFLTEAIKYELTDEQAKSFLEQIYLSESDNITKTSEAERLKVVVGGVYTGPGLVADGAISYYRIDMEDDKNQDGVLAPFDIIRNHSYIFNITAVNNPGTPTPEEALDEAVVGLTVEVKDYTEVPMQGITPQYTLTVDNSTFGFEGITVTKGILNVTTDGTTWAYEKSTGESEDNSWFTLTDEDKTDNSGKIIIKPQTNLTGKIRTGYFYVKAGKIAKRITVVQEPGETANCYLIRVPDTYLLETDIKGNGNNQAWKGDSETSGTIAIDFSTGTSLAITNVAILWETSEGLVTVDNDKADKNTDNTYKTIPYTVHDVNDQWRSSVFTPGHGGNALIGGFNSEGELVWSWHIWVVGDYANGINYETWVTGLDFMDRYLGAYSNQPGVRSLGLLYQWGRKDPFIGAGEIVRDYTKTKKARTYHYTPYGRDYTWGTFSGDETVLNSISQPTKILTMGFLSASNTAMDKSVARALWGTSSSSINVKDNGVKTMYDPCPPGYRVPSVHSWIFKRNSGNTTLYNSNYYWNSRYVPYRGNDGFDANNYGTESFTSESPYYGFWIDYTVNESSTAPAVVQYGEEGYEREQWGTIKSSQATPLTWLPLAGVYSGNMDSFSDVGGFSSLHVNGIVWLNAPSAANTNRPAGVFLHGTEGKVTNTTTWNTVNKTASEDFYIQDNDGEYVVDSSERSENGKYEYSNNRFFYRGEGEFRYDRYNVTFRKANWRDYNVPKYKMASSGTTYETWESEFGYSDSGRNGNGRHLHELDETDNDLLALPQYAGSVRCIRDKDAVVSTNNVIDKTAITLSNTNSYTMTVKVTAVETWSVTNPGAKWVNITPTKGGIGETTITISSEAPTSGSETATITIKFARGSTKTITVTRQK